MSSDYKILIANIVSLAHAGFVSYVLLVPVLAPWFMLPGHIGACMLLMGHWATNNNECAWTMIESKLRGIPVESGFIYSIVRPVFQRGRFSFGDWDDQSLCTCIIWVVTISLCLVSIWRLCTDPHVTGWFRKVAQILPAHIPGGQTSHVPVSSGRTSFGHS